MMQSQVDFLLIAPPEMAFMDIGPNNASMGVFSICSFLRAKGYEGAFLNANYLPSVRTYQKTSSEKQQSHSKAMHFWRDLSHPRWQALFEYIDQMNPLILGITCLDSDVYPSKIIAKKVKEKHPDMIVVVGGPTPTVYPQIFADCPEIDLCVQGEGEMTLLEILQTLRAGGDIYSISGTCRLENGEWKKNMPRLCIGDSMGLDALPFVDRDFLYFDPETYDVQHGVQLDGLLTSRGCAHTCKFCCASHIWHRKLFFRTIDSVIDEMLELRQRYGQKFDHFYIHDDNFPSNTKRVEEFSAKVRALDEKFRFRCFSRVRPLKDDRIIYALIRAGCTETLIGVETGSDYVLKTMGKGLTVAESAEVADLLNAYEMKWRAFFIMGTPYERIEDAQQTIAFVKRIKAPISRIYCYAPYLGSDFFHAMPELGISMDLDRILLSNQEIGEYMGNLIPKDVYDSMFAEADAAAFENIAAWEREFLLDDAQLQQAVNIENSVVNFFRDKWQEPVLIVGEGRDIRWCAALLHSAFPNHKFQFFDVDYPHGRELVFGRFLSIEELPSWHDGTIYTIGSCPSLGSTFPQSMAVDTGVYRQTDRQLSRELPETPGM